MIEVSSDLIKKAVYELCYQADICLPDDVYSKILGACRKEKNSDAECRLKYILKNAQAAYKEKIPLCQDTGQVMVFLEIGQKVIITGDFIEAAVNDAVKQCYEENFFRKSIVNNAVFDRTNTKTNTPCVIYTKYTNGSNIKIKVLIKGAGSENQSRLEMLLPLCDENEIVKKCSELILKAGINACPPMFIGIGAGGTADKALLLSKEALIANDFTEQEKILALKIKEAANRNAPDYYKNCYVLDVKLKTAGAHIACLPIGITINCHSDRYAYASISDGKVIYEHKIPDFIDLDIETDNLKEIKADDIESLKSLKQGEKFLLTGEIYTARDAAHKKLTALIKEDKPLPFDIKDKIIFYAGPCPAPEGRITGSIGPTTASRMDKYAEILYEYGVFASIGKGSRSLELQKYIKENGKRYFSLQGGIAALLAQKVLTFETAAFEELGPEAVYKLYAAKIPLTAEI